MSKIYPITNITKLSKQPQKEFDMKGYKVVLSNLEDVGMIIGKDLTQILIREGIIDQVIEELEESQDKTTVKMVKESKSGKKYKDSVTLESFKKNLKK
jgi:hypothetical protein